jgi:tetratricopeptide (TPR) repeat protein
MGHNDEALARYRKSIAVLQPFFDQQNEAVTYQYLSCEQSLALLYASTGDHAAALELANRAFAQAEKYSGQLSLPDSRTAVAAEGWSVLAVAQSKAGMVDQARQIRRDRYYYSCICPGLPQTSSKPGLKALVFGLFSGG